MNRRSLGEHRRSPQDRVNTEYYHHHNDVEAEGKRGEHVFVHAGAHDDAPPPARGVFARGAAYRFAARVGAARVLGAGTTRARDPEARA